MKFLTLIIASLFMLGSSLSLAQKTDSTKPEISVPMLPEVDLQADQAVQDWLKKKFEANLTQPNITPSSDLNAILKGQLETLKKTDRKSVV